MVFKASRKPAAKKTTESTKAKATKSLEPAVEPVTLPVVEESVTLPPLPVEDFVGKPIESDDMPQEAPLPSISIEPIPHNNVIIVCGEINK